MRVEGFAYIARGPFLPLQNETRHGRARGRKYSRVTQTALHPQRVNALLRPGCQDGLLSSQELQKKYPEQLCFENRGQADRQPV